MFRRKNTILKSLTSALIIASMMFSLAACGSKKKENSNLNSNVTPEVIEDRAATNEFINAQASFSVELFKKEFSSNFKGNNNILISPESISMALAMTANGSDGNTKQEMYNVLCPGIPQNEYNEYMRTQCNRLTSSQDVIFNEANSIWIKDEFDVKESFLQTNVNYYNSEVFSSDFSNKTVEEVNSWIKEKTNNMIPKALDALGPDTVMLLINAIAFEGDWADPYEEYQAKENRTFTNYNNQEENVTMLCSTEDTYIHDDNSTGFIKYYKGNEFAFMAILPNEDISLDEYVNSLSGESFVNLYNTRTYEDVVCELPEFSYDYDTELNNSLEELGIVDAFSEHGADFGNITDISNRKIFISRVIHKTHIEVDRNGTKAAAATVIVMDAESCAPDEELPKYVYLDRPFVYAIIDTTTGLPVFIGTVSSIEN